MAALSCHPASVHLAKERCSQSTHSFHYPAGEIAKVHFLVDPLRAYASKQPRMLVGSHWALLGPLVASHGKKMVGVVDKGDLGQDTVLHAVAGLSGETTSSGLLKV